MIIGDKKDFAVEIEIIEHSPSLVGYSRLWIENNTIGNFTSKEMLYPLINSLSVDRRWLEKGNIPSVDMGKIKSKKFMFKLLSDYDFFVDHHVGIISSNQNLVTSFSRCSFSASENFDDTNILRFTFKNDLYFAWEKAQTKNENEENIILSRTTVKIFCDVIIKLEEFTNYKPQPYFLD
jgi:hypothetical protein